jgi:hypothetical protein
VLAELEMKIMERESSFLFAGGGGRDARRSTIYFSSLAKLFLIQEADGF